MSQENGFSPVCVSMWHVKEYQSENADSQTLQENGFSPMCLHVAFKRQTLWKMWSTDFTRIVSLPYAFTSDFSNGNGLKMLIQKSYKKILALQCAFWILNKLWMLIFSGEWSWLSLKSLFLLLPWNIN